MSSDTTAAFTPPRPLAADDDTAAFDCGRDALNHWFRRHAWRNQELGISRTTVICDAEAGSIVGYVSLSTAQVERAWLPKAQQRNRPDPLPAILLGQLAVDLRWQGRGIARHRCGSLVLGRSNGYGASDLWEEPSWGRAACSDL